MCVCARVRARAAFINRKGAPIAGQDGGEPSGERASSGAVQVGGDGGWPSWGSWQRNPRPAQVFRTSSPSSSQTVVSFLLN